METQYNVFIQWNENTNNYKRFDGGLEVPAGIKEHFVTVHEANKNLQYCLIAERFHDYNIDSDGVTDIKTGAVVVSSDSTEPASYDFGDGTIYVAEVQP